jgi:hypothetical protein
MLSQAWQPTLNYKLQLATNDITAIFTLHPLTPTVLLPPMSQGIHEFIKKANDMQSHHYPGDGDSQSLKWQHI